MQFPLAPKYIFRWCKKLHNKSVRQNTPVTKAVSFFSVLEANNG